MAASDPASAAVSLFQLPFSWAYAVLRYLWSIADAAVHVAYTTFSAALAFPFRLVRFLASLVFGQDQRVAELVAQNLALEAANSQLRNDAKRREARLRELKNELLLAHADAARLLSERDAAIAARNTGELAGRHAASPEGHDGPGSKPRPTREVLETQAYAQLSSLVWLSLLAALLAARVFLASPGGGVLDRKLVWAFGLGPLGFAFLFRQRLGKGPAGRACAAFMLCVSWLTIGFTANAVVLGPGGLPAFAPEAWGFSTRGGGG